MRGEIITGNPLDRPSTGTKKVSNPPKSTRHSPPPSAERPTITVRSKDLERPSLPKELVSSEDFPSQLTPGIPPPKPPHQKLQNSQSNSSTLSETFTTSMAHVSSAGPSAENDSILEDFSDRVRHLYKLFHLSAEAVCPLTTTSVPHLLKAACWWFLKGRSSLDVAVNDRSSTAEGHRTSYFLRQQGHIDLAKSLWLVKEVTLQRLQLIDNHERDSRALIASADTFGDRQRDHALQRCGLLLSNIEKLTVSMKRNNCFPPSKEDALLPQGLDTSIWIQYPLSSVETNFLLPSLGPESAMSMEFEEDLPLGDTLKSFNYTRLFVDFIPSVDGNPSVPRYPCILFVQRRSEEQSLYLRISSQNHMIDFSLQLSKTRSPSWDDVQWDAKTTSLLIRLPNDVRGRIECSSRDYMLLQTAYDQNTKILANMRPRAGERITLDITTKELQYVDRVANRHRFPSGAISDCQIRIFEKIPKEPPETEASTSQTDLRLAIITTTEHRNLSGVSYDMSDNELIQYDFVRSDSGFPALLLRFGVQEYNTRMIVVFKDDEQRSALHQCVIRGSYKGIEKMVVPLKDLLISPISPSWTPESTTSLQEFHWTILRVTEKEIEGGRSVVEERATSDIHLRIIAEAINGSLACRLDFARGEIGLRVKSLSSVEELSILSRSKLYVAVSESRVPKTTSQALTDFLETISGSQTIHSYRFFNLTDLHTFQQALTGYVVKFDNTVTSFAIARRRLVVHKKWEALLARVQLLVCEESIKLAAFFDDFKHGVCMNIDLHPTDVFESYNKGENFYVRLVDARFELPKMRSESGGSQADGFLVLSPKNGPAEHDDVTINFDSAPGMFLQTSFSENERANVISKTVISLLKLYPPQSKLYRDLVL